MGEFGGIPKLQCSFLQETDEFSGLCKQERYRDGESMRQRYGPPGPGEARKSKLKLK